MWLLKVAIIFPLLLLVGCTQKDQVVIIKHEPQPSSQESPSKQNHFFKAEMKGTIFINKKIIRVIGHSNLKKGTILVVKHNDQSLGKVKVEQKGEFYASYVNPDLQKGDRILILLKSGLQSKKLQSVYGESGEKLKGVFTFSYDRL